ncbi:MAG: cytochrome c biogenesis protein CcsA [Anaerolineales bacterium]
MAAEIGFGALFITLIFAVYSIVAAVYGQKNKSQAWILSARQAMILVFPLLTVTIAAMLYLLVTDDFQVAYVADVSSRSMPVYLKLTALWGGQAGSLLFWSWLLAGFGSAVALRKWDRDGDLLPWVVVVNMITLAFFLVLNIFYENPFLRYWQDASGILTSFRQPKGALPIFPRDGSGLNPLLRHPGMIIHPPMQYLGFVGFIIPFSYAIASLITGRTDDRWIQISRGWTLWAWLFLSLGLVLGARWAYDVLGWGGYWGWDPVENSALMPWLTGTAYLHAVLIHEKRSMFKEWSLLLIIITYLLVIYGTFITRSGLLSSVHSFAQSRIGPVFLGFIALTVIITAWLLNSRWKKLQSQHALEKILTREGLIIISVVLFLGLMVTVFWGVLFPTISELATGQKVTVGPPFYERVAGPIMGGILILMVLCPLAVWSFVSYRHLGRLLWKPFLVSLIGIALPVWGGLTRWPALIAFWLVAFVLAVNIFEFFRRTRLRRRTENESWGTALARVLKRNQRSYGAMIVHVGVVLMALGVIGIEFFQTETQGTLAEGQSLSLAPYTMTYEQLDVFDDMSSARNVARAVISVEKDGRVLGELNPRRDFYYDSGQPVTLPGVRSTLIGGVLVATWPAKKKSTA